MDLNKVGALLHIVEKCNNHGPALSNISQMATMELAVIETECRDELVKRKQAEDEERSAAIATERKAREDERAKNDPAYAAELERQRTPVDPEKPEPASTYHGLQTELNKKSNEVASGGGSGIGPGPVGSGEPGPRQADSEVERRV
jgi:hypothetical protein